MSQPKNPITEKLLILAHEGKHIRSIAPPEKNMQPNKKVVFHFADGSTQELQTESDNRTFMRWWGETRQVLCCLKDIEDLPPPPQA